MFVVVRHPDITNPGVIPVAALAFQRERGWYRVSEEREQPADFHLPDYLDAEDLDAQADPALPAETEEQ
jgi:hypothetical protein